MASTTSCLKHSISEAPEVHEQILLAALGSTILLGVALFWVLRAERRKAIFEPRLRAIAMPTSNPDSAVVSLRRTRPDRRAMPDALFARLDADLAATGDRIRLVHLVGTGSLATAMVGCM